MGACLQPRVPATGGRLKIQADWERFAAKVHARLVQGERVFDNKSLDKANIDLVDEIQQELEDIAGWGVLLWIRLERVKTLAKQLEQAP